MKRWYVSVCLAILLVATGLRFYHLDTQSFWNDEGNTARLVERSVALIIEGAAGDIHPPGYYLLLHVWRVFAGESEFALRAFSALCGVLTVAVAAAAGRYVGGQRVSLGAALIMAFHPLAVYYSQEARMYALLGLASALTLWAGMRIANYELRITYHASRITPHVLLLALTIALGLYTQYAYIFVL
ncbi:MAG: glycosyltransferase family 39 protein, partial [Anaerolineae bacterium]